MDTQVMERARRLEDNPRFLVELLEDRARDHHVDRPSSRSVYDKRLTDDTPRPGFDREPHFVYFYYVRLDSGGRLRVKHYTYDNRAPIPYETLEQVLQGLVDNARGTDDNPASDGSDFNAIEWRRISYIAFFVDEESWSFYNKDDALAGISFDHSPVPNHTFFDGIDLELEVADETTGAVTKRSAIAFINHMKRNAAGDKLRKEKQKFKFDMNFKVEFADGGAPPLTVILDPDGTNMGPPVPPP
ncbi:MAG: hypothetical protein QOH86_821 [Sphingomonadales bacterium]|jgi:hypothetical protein|nr:hypothetical protein [Sphingomonadales bacterium]